MPPDKVLGEVRLKYGFRRFSARPTYDGRDLMAVVTVTDPKLTPGPWRRDVRRGRTCIARNGGCGYKDSSRKTMNGAK